MQTKEETTEVMVHHIKEQLASKEPKKRLKINLKGKEHFKKMSKPREKTKLSGYKR